MKFPFQILNGLDDAQQNFEALESLDILDQTAESVLQLAVTGTKRKIAFGTVSLTFTASTTSAAASVSHGLGVAPVGVWLQLGALTAVGGAVTATSSSTFTAQAFTTNVATVTGTVPFYWLAIG